MLLAYNGGCTHALIQPVGMDSSGDQEKALRSIKALLQLIQVTAVCSYYVILTLMLEGGQFLLAGETRKTREIANNHHIYDDKFSNFLKPSIQHSHFTLHIVIGPTCPHT